MIIEQEFFEAFNMSEEYFEFVSNGKIFTANTIEEFKTKYPNDLLIGKPEKKKRIITPEIVLGLLKIVLMRDKYAFYFNKSSGKFVFQENINTFTECRKKFYQDYKLINAVLKACIQLKIEIQTQVQQLFKEA